MAVVVDYLHFNRGDTGVRLANSDVLEVNGYHVLRKRALKAGTGTAATNVTLLPHSAVSELRALLSVWRQVQTGVCIDWQGAAMAVACGGCHGTVLALRRPSGRRRK